MYTGTTGQLRRIGSYVSGAGCIKLLSMGTLCIVYQDMVVWKLNRSHCVMFLSEFMLICAGSQSLSSLYFRIMK